MIPFDIEEKEFSKALNGYKKTEVDEFLSKISDGFESIIRESDFLKTQISSSDKKILEYQNQENSLKEALLVAQITSEEMIKKAQNQADEILKHAEEESEKILKVVKSEYIKMENSTLSLKKDYMNFKEKYKNILKAQIKLLDDMNIM